MFSASRLAIARALYDNDVSSVDLPDYDFMAIFCLVIVMDDKGGIGKSLLAQLLTALLRCNCDKEEDVLVIDSDSENSTSYQIDPQARMLDLKRNREGAFLNAFKRVRDGTCRHIVVDVGAREEQPMTAMLPWLLSIVRRLGGRIIVARPITLGSHNQRNARRFMDTADHLDIPVILVQNEGQGRDGEYFEDWRNSRTCEQCLELGAAQTEMLDFGVRNSDEAIGFGLSLADCAVQNFEKIDDVEERELAQNYFVDDICAMINERLRVCMRRIGDACQVTVDKRHDIMHTRATAHPDQTTTDIDGQPKPRRKKGCLGMRDKFLQAYRNMQRAGANPRRADPRYAKPIVLALPQAVAMAAVFVAIGFTLGAFGLHVTTLADIRLAAIVRSALPDADAASQDDIVARLSTPSAVVTLLAPLVATDPARETIVPDSWIGAIRGGPTPVTSPDRMRALGEIATALAPLPADERADQIDTIVALYKATRDPSSRAIIATVGALPSQQRDHLAANRMLQPILAGLATLPDTVWGNLGSDSDRLRFAVSIAGIAELSDAQLFDLSMGLSDKTLRAVLIYVVDQVRLGNPEIMTRLNSYWNQTHQPPNPSFPAPATRLRHAR